MVYVRRSGIVAAVIVLASFILGILVLLAGTSPTFLEQYEMFSFNLTSLKYNLTSQGYSASDVNSTIPDFYRFHVGKTCIGNFSAADGSQQNTTCSNMNGFDFLQQASTALSLNSTSDNNNQKDLWTVLNDTLNVIDTVGNNLNPAGSSGSNTTFYIYCVAIAVVGVSLVGAIAGIFTDGKMSATLNLVVDLLAFVLMAVASGLANFIAVAVSGAINGSEDDGGITATVGIGFLVMTWISTVLMLVASITWCVACGSRRRRGMAQGSGHTTIYTTVFRTKHEGV